MSFFGFSLKIGSNLLTRIPLYLSTKRRLVGGLKPSHICFFKQHVFPHHQWRWDYCKLKLYSQLYPQHLWRYIHSLNFIHIPLVVHKRWWVFPTIYWLIKYRDGSKCEKTWGTTDFRNIFFSNNPIIGVLHFIANLRYPAKNDKFFAG